jgi:hypothetical protein
MKKKSIYSAVWTTVMFVLVMISMNCNMKGSADTSEPADPIIPVPAEWKNLYDSLNYCLDQLHADIDQRWDHALYPPFVAMASVLPANSNAGPSILHPGNLDTVKLFITRLREMGCKGVQLDIQFPIMDPAFFDFAKSNGLMAADSPGADDYLQFYKNVAAEIRSQGLVFSIESQVVFTQAVFSPLPVAPYYESFDQDGAAGLTRYKNQKLEMLRKIARELRPDYLTICDEPETEMWLTKIRLLQNRETYVQIVRELVDGVRPEAPAGMKLGCGFLPGTNNWNFWAERYLDLDIDFYNIHIYPVDIFPDDPADNVYQRILRVADIAAAAGKKVVVGENWLYKQGQNDSRDIEVIYGRDFFDFWQPLDGKFLSLLLKIAHHKKFAYISPFWSSFFFSYLGYDESKDLTMSERQKLNNGRVSANLRNGVYSSTGKKYSRLIHGQFD